MTPRYAMPVMRQLPRDTDRPLWRRLLQIREPVVYELVEDYEFVARIWGNWTHMWLPAGFRSDLASTPALTWLLGFRPDGPMMIPSLYHDWYYRHGSIEARVGMAYEPGRWTRPFGFNTRRGGDRLFLQVAERATGLRLPPRIAWLALRLFGWIAWRRNKKYRDAYIASGEREFQLHGDYK